MSFLFDVATGFSKEARYLLPPRPKKSLLDPPKKRRPTVLEEALEEDDGEEKEAAQLTFTVPYPTRQTPKGIPSDMAQALDDVDTFAPIVDGSSRKVLPPEVGRRLGFEPGQSYLPVGADDLEGVAMPITPRPNLHPYEERLINQAKRHWFASNNPEEPATLASYASPMRSGLLGALLGGASGAATMGGLSAVTGGQAAPAALTGGLVGALLGGVSGHAIRETLNEEADDTIRRTLPFSRVADMQAQEPLLRRLLSGDTLHGSTFRVGREKAANYVTTPQEQAAIQAAFGGSGVPAPSPTMGPAPRPAPFVAPKTSTVGASLLPTAAPPNPASAENAGAIAGIRSSILGPLGAVVLGSQAPRGYGLQGMLQGGVMGLGGGIGSGLGLAASPLLGNTPLARGLGQVIGGAGGAGLGYLLTRNPGMEEAERRERNSKGLLR